MTEHKKFDDYIAGLSIDSLKQAAGRFFKDNVVEIHLLQENIKDDQVNPMLKE
jgi:hypothetical protein